MGKRVLGRLAAVAGGGVLALVMATPGYADSLAGINDDHVPTTAANFSPQECTEPFAGLPDNVDGWHFVLPSADGADNFVSLTLTFDTPGGEVVAVIDKRNPHGETDVALSFGSGWSGYIIATGSGDYRHAYMFTEAGWTLTAGSAMIEEATEFGSFNLSHVCAASPGTPPSEPPASQPPASQPPASEPPASQPPATVPPEQEGDDEPELPITGLQTGGLVALGVGLLAAGAAMLVVRRRRNPANLVDEA